MNPDTKYLIDANVFIQAKNLFYRFDFCQAFWEWITQAYHAGIVFSIDKVRAELAKGKDDDPIRLWIDRLPKEFFMPDTKDNAVMNTYREVMKWNVANTHYSEHAKKEFARAEVADAFLISVAKAHKCVIVTHELSKPDARKRVPIPNAADACGVKSMMIYDLLSHYAKGNFTLKL